jgi:hypothetical protein
MAVKKGATGKKRTAAKKAPSRKPSQGMAAGSTPFRAETIALKELMLLQKTKRGLLSGKEIGTAEQDALLDDYLRSFSA